MPFHEWLVQMLQRSGAKPGAGLMALFDILQQWMDAPGFRQAIQQELLAQRADEPLLDYLQQQAVHCGCADAVGVARQVYYLALGALHEELRQPGCGAVAGARQAAAILLSPPGKPKRRYAAAAIAAALACLLMLPPARLQQDDSGSGLSASHRPAADTQAMRMQQASLSPDQRFTLHQTLERLQRGVCQYPQALMLPPEQRPVLIENVVNGEPSASRSNLLLVQQVAQSVDCYYAPIAMTM